MIASAIINYQLSITLNMLIPITRTKFEELVPILAMGVQYKYCWGKWSDFLRRTMISIASVGLVYSFLPMIEG